MRLVMPVIALALLLTSTLSGLASTEHTLIQADPGEKVVYTNPAWSPDERSIAYVAVSNAEKLDSGALYGRDKSVWIATVRGGEWKHKLLLKDADCPVWSPDGKQLVFARNGLAVLTLSTGKVRQLTKDKLPKFSDRDDAEATTDCPVSFSPNGRYVAFHRHMWDENETRVFNLTLNRDVGLVIGHYFDWSPDSRYVLSAFNWFQDDQVTTRLIRTDLLRRKWRTLLRNYRIQGVVWPETQRYAWVLLVNREPRTYPQFIDYPENELDPPEGPGMYRLDLDSRQLRKVADVQRWIFPSPDYRRFVFPGISGESGQTALYVGYTPTWQFRLLSTEARDPWDWHVRTRFINWSPDGRSLAYVTGQGDIRIVRFDAQ